MTLRPYRVMAESKKAERYRRRSGAVADLGGSARGLDPELVKKLAARSSRGGGGSGMTLADVERSLQKAEATGDDGLISFAKDMASGAFKGGAKAIGGLFDALDTGRAAIVAGAIELGDGLRALAGKDPIGDHGRIKDSGFSLGDFIENTKNNVGVGDVLETPGVTDDLPMNVKRALGFVGDVALDPLTYATFGTSVGAKEAGKGAGKLLRKEDVVRRLVGMTDEEAARFGGRQAVEEVADEVARLGAGRLGRKGREGLAEAINVTPGMTFANRVLPGTERLSSAAAGSIGRATRAVKSKTVDKINDNLWAKLSSKGAIRAVERKLGPVTAIKMRGVLDKLRTDLGQWTHTQTERWEALREGLEASVDKDALRRALEDPEWFAKAGKDLPRAAVELRRFMDELADEAERLTGRPIPRLDNYLPHSTSEAFQALANQGDALGRLDKQRKVALKGSMFLGEQVEKGTIDELEGIARRILGDDYVRIFKDDPWELTYGYIHQIQNYIRRYGTPKALADAGLAEVMDVAAVDKMMKALDGRTGQLTADIARLEDEARKEFDQARKSSVDAQRAFDKAQQTRDQQDNLLAFARQLREEAGPERAPVEGAADRAKVLAEDAKATRATRKEAERELKALERDLAKAEGKAAKAAAATPAQDPLERAEAAVARSEQQVAEAQARLDEALAKVGEAPEVPAGAGEQFARDNSARNWWAYPVRPRDGVKLSPAEQALEDARQVFVETYQRSTRAQGLRNVIEGRARSELAVTPEEARQQVARLVDEARGPQAAPEAQVADAVEEPTVEPVAAKKKAEGWNRAEGKVSTSKDGRHEIEGKGRNWVLYERDQTGLRKRIGEFPTKKDAQSAAADGVRFGDVRKAKMREAAQVAERVAQAEADVSAAQAAAKANAGARGAHSAADKAKLKAARRARDEARAEWRKTLRDPALAGARAEQILGGRDDLLRSLVGVDADAVATKADKKVADKVERLTKRLTERQAKVEAVDTVVVESRAKYDAAMERLDKRGIKVPGYFDPAGGTDMDSLARFTHENPPTTVTHADGSTSQVSAFQTQWNAWFDGLSKSDQRLVSKAMDAQQEYMEALYERRMMRRQGESVMNEETVSGRIDDLTREAQGAELRGAVNQTKVAADKLDMDVKGSTRHRLATSLDDELRQLDAEINQIMSTDAPAPIELMEREVQLLARIETERRQASLRFLVGKARQGDKQAQKAAGTVLDFMQRVEKGVIPPGRVKELTPKIDEILDAGEQRMLREGFVDTNVKPKQAAAPTPEPTPAPEPVVEAPAPAAPAVSAAAPDELDLLDEWESDLLELLDREQSELDAAFLAVVDEDRAAAEAARPKAPAGEAYAKARQEQGRVRGQLTLAKKRHAKAVADLEELKAVDTLDNPQAAIDDGAERLAELRARVQEGESRLSELEERELSLLAESENLAKLAVGEENPVLRQAAEIEAAAMSAQAMAARDGLGQAGAAFLGDSAAARGRGMAAKVAAGKAEAELASLKLGQSQLALMVDDLQSRLVQFADNGNVWGDESIVEAVDAIAKLAQPGEVNKLLKLHDSVLARWKAYSLMSPGYHSRNFFSGIFMNALAGMDGNSLGTYRKFGKAWKALQDDGLDAALKQYKTPEEKAAFRTMVEWQDNLFGRRQVRDYEDATMNAANRGLLGGQKGSLRRKVDPTALDNAAIKFNFDRAEGVERRLRGPLFMDGIMSGLSPEEAYGRVVRFHFDYTDLGQFEKRFVRRVVPFYTWTRKNLPLQIEMIARRPGTYTRYWHAKRNLELGVPEDEVTPLFYGPLAIRSPFTAMASAIPQLRGEEGARIHLMPDLPFMTLDETFDQGKMLGQLSPIVKAPIEVGIADKQMFSGIPFNDELVEMPKTWAWMGPILKHTGGKFGLPSVTEKNGKYFISDRSAYKIEQAMPLLGRARRLAPSEERFQNRAITSTLSVIFGLSSRTNDSKAQSSELFRRQKAIEAALRRHKNVLEAGEE